MKAKSRHADKGNISEAAFFNFRKDREPSPALPISIPIFTSQLEKSREAVDAANIRAAYAEVMAAAITGDTAGMSKKVTLKQEVAGWQNTFEFPANLKPADGAAQPTAKQADVEIKYTPAADGTETNATISILLVKKTA